MRRRRVFVTGLGVVSPHGEGPRNVFDRVYRAESAVRRVYTGTPERGRESLLATADFDPGERIPKIQRLFMSRAAQMAVISADGALRESGLLGADGMGPPDAGVYVGCGLGGAEVLEEGYQAYFGDKKKAKPSLVPRIMASAPASSVCMRFGLRGPAHTYSIACASSSVAIGEAFRALRDGYLEVALAGGAEAMLNDGSVAAWAGLGVFAREHRDGAAASSRPFDGERTGFVLGEGAVFLVLETAERARARGAVPVAEIVGYGASNDAYKLTEPAIEGQEQAMRGALADAGITGSEIGYVNAHATGTPTGDPVEVAALARVLGPAADGVPVSSTKAVHGHLVGASGALECMLTALALNEQRIPPTAHLTSPDPACALDCVPLVGREVRGLEFALTNSFAFGGSNATLVLRKAE